MFVYALVACLPARVPVVDTGPGPEAPTVTAAEVTCNATDEEWTFSVDASAWTGGGDLWMSTDGVYVETDELTSTAAAADGTSDHLELDLDIVPDWRQVSKGSSTFFNCGTPGLEGVFVVYERDGSTVAGCRRFGDTDSWASWGIGYACADSVEIGD